MLDGDLDNRIREVHGLEDDRVVLVAQVIVTIEPYNPDPETLEERDIALITGVMAREVARYAGS